MERSVYRQFYELESTHWWFRGMRAICRAVLERAGVRRGARSLDVGCGTGLWTRELAALGPVLAADTAPEALRFCRERGLRSLVRASGEALPFDGGRCDLVTALGVIEHVEGDRRFLEEMRRVVAPGGHVLLLTSAHPILWSRHDEIVHHKRRYVPHRFRSLLRESGFDVVRLTGVNTILFLPVLFARLAGRLRRRPDGECAGTPDFRRSAPWVNAALYGILALEARLLRHLGFPFGVGLLALLRRPRSPVRVRKRRSGGGLWSAFAGAPLGAKLRILGRSAICPFRAVLKHLPERGRILDVGCGDGLLFRLALRERPGGTWEGTGIDHDERKIAVAKRLRNARLSFSHMDLSGIPSGTCDCVTVVDVLCTVPLEDWAGLLRDCMRVLRPGGTLIVKDAVDRPRWKRWFAYVEEIIAIKVIRMTKGASPHFEPVGTFRRLIEDAGGEVLEVERVDAWRPHAHCLFVARKRESPRQPGGPVSA